MAAVGAHTLLAELGGGFGAPGVPPAAVKDRRLCGLRLHGSQCSAGGFVFGLRFHIRFIAQFAGEARNGSDEEYTAERLAGVLRGTHGLAPQRVTDACLADLEAFLAGASYSDDLTLMAIQRAG